MTSRRGFFGLLAAAPLVAPVIAQEIVKSFPVSKGIGRGGWVEIRTASGVGAESFIRGIRTLNEVREMEGLPPLPFVLSVPNRLYGAQINADGEAV